MGWLQETFEGIGDWFQDFAQRIGDFFVRWHEQGFTEAFANSAIMRYYANWIDRGGPPFVQKMETVFLYISNEQEAGNALGVARGLGQFLGSAILSPIGQRAAKAALTVVGVPPQATAAVLNLAEGLWDSLNDEVYERLVSSGQTEAAEEYSIRRSIDFLRAAGIKPQDWPEEIQHFYYDGDIPEFGHFPAPAPHGLASQLVAVAYQTPAYEPPPPKKHVQKVASRIVAAEYVSTHGGDIPLRTAPPEPLEPGPEVGTAATVFGERIASAAVVFLQNLFRKGATPRNTWGLDVEMLVLANTLQDMIDDVSSGVLETENILPMREIWEIQGELDAWLSEAHRYIYQVNVPARNTHPDTATREWLDDYLLPLVWGDFDGTKSVPFIVRPLIMASALGLYDEQYLEALQTAGIFEALGERFEAVYGAVREAVTPSGDTLRTLAMLGLGGLALHAFITRA